MPQTVTVNNLPGFVQDANQPNPDYIVGFDGSRYPLTSIDSAYALANNTCRSLAMTPVFLSLASHPAYRTAPSELKDAILASFLQVQIIQARNLTGLAMLFRAYSLRTGFQTDYMKAHNWSLTRIVAPDQNGNATSYSCTDYDDWLRVAKNLTADALRQSARKPNITLGPTSATMGVAAAAAALAPVVLTTAEAGTAVAATTGAVAAAEVAGTSVLAAGGTVAQGFLATMAWPIVGVVAVITLGAVTTYTVNKAMAWWANRDAAAQKQAEEDAAAYLKALEDLKNCNTEACRQNARERIEILNQRRNDDAAQAGGLGNLMFGGGFDFQKIAYMALGLTGVYLGLQLFLKNKSA